MATTDGRPIQIVTRKAINLRLPFDLIDDADKLAAELGWTRTDIIVRGTQMFINAARRKGGTGARPGKGRRR